MRFGLVSTGNRSRGRRSHAAASEIPSSATEARATWGNVASDQTEEGAPVLLGYFRFTSPETDAVLVRDADGAVENDIVKVVTRKCVVVLESRRRLLFPKNLIEYWSFINGLKLQFKLSRIVKRCSLHHRSHLTDVF